MKKNIKSAVLLYALYIVAYSRWITYLFFFIKMGSHCVYGTISFFHLCAVVNLFWLESFSVCLSGIGFETFIALTLVHGVNFETIPTSTLGIISFQ